MIQDDEYIIYISEAEVIAYSKSAFTQRRRMPISQSKMQDLPAKR